MIGGTNFSPGFHFYTPLKTSENFWFSGDIEMKHCAKIDEIRITILPNILVLYSRLYLFV